MVPETDREEAAGALLFIEEPITKNKKNKLKNEEDHSVDHFCR